MSNRTPALRITRQHRGHRRLHGVHRSLTVRHGDDLKGLPPLAQTKQCPTGKRPYVNQLEADTVLSCIDRSDFRRRERRSYPCRNCDGWHLTSWSMEDFEVRRGDATDPEDAKSAAPYADTAKIATPIAASPMPGPFEGANLSSITVRPTDTIPTPNEVAARLATTTRQRPTAVDPAEQTYSTALQQNPPGQPASCSLVALAGHRLWTPLRDLLGRFYRY